jgi:hypothetical protein
VDMFFLKVPKKEKARFCLKLEKEKLVLTSW